MKMEKVLFNLLMETCFLPEEICGADLTPWNKDGLRERGAVVSPLPGDTAWQLNQLPIQTTHGARIALKFLFDSLLF